MTKGILGKKIGMTQVFTAEGIVVPVTVIEAGPCVVLQKKDQTTDGYEAIQIGFADKKEVRANKPEKGHAAKANTTPKRFVRELRNVDLAGYEVGQELKADIFAEGDVVDVTGTSKGKGFAGAIKRHGQARGPMAHGSRYHRRPGSMGPVAANRVPKGKALPGRMGGEKITVQNLEVVSVDTERNLLLIKGAIPGPKNSFVVVKSAIKGSK
ncbi:50S ribosomal protein L3 [Aneurinibacillus aneurinilyticus]|jgi:large subunit ribosomal protein L3|uniref:Large ribosomal subunit protein uL3 n=2 Tax=Aneurinibacillus aneurinilyticus TaxID=1391 RepID=A0A848CX33_ANEAE|nr:50S ribosomal protein L3 [Aneurinibacillus aneurinilyticus]ERI06785.1 50S ribosomal protein L3 [Aneurinibacillus aneurinilyticus ATCC 12856]MCI1695204.1 50S ribosomal protein L3 [Aneurinibacillus aneurinilyticus]MED0673281.1 50S ribosomal protein L3 [Aneurinibacillus aneurinilyticus]MED0707347.1 50S ribosomal protein L3 [Aneurinibacillus aneurinilyticus]MED0721606.1 50S ribosomal protein L3 [Aneurinibacillus aneurinilyticus]